MANALHTPGVVDSKAARLDDGGLLALQGPGALDVRTGVLVGPGSTALVTGTSSTSPMRYSINPNHWVASRSAASGPYRGTLEATQLVDTTAAPGTGSRIDVIWAKQQDNTVGIPSPDGTVGEQYGCTQGTATTGTPTKPSIPVGAVELATGTVSAGATSTNGSGVVITQTARQTVARGARVPVRNQAERDALTAFPSLEVYRLDTGQVQLCTAAGPPTVWKTTYDPAGYPVTRLTLAAGWAHATLYEPLHISSDDTDVRIRGTILNTASITTSTVSLILPGGGIPAALRPKTTVQRGVLCTFGAQGAGFPQQRVDIFIDGGMQFTSSVSGGAGLSFSFDIGYTTLAIP